MKNNSLFLTTYLILVATLSAIYKQGDDTMVLEIQVEIQNSLTNNLLMMKRDYCNTDQRQCISCKFIRNF